MGQRVFPASGPWTTADAAATSTDRAAAGPSDDFSLDDSLTVLRAANWLRLSRVLCGWLLLLIIAPGIVDNGVSLDGIPASLAFIALVASLWDWRARKMGVRITREGIEAVRAVDTVRLGWDEIAGFSLRHQGSGPWGDKSILVHRKTYAGFRVPARVGFRLPAFLIVGQGNPVGRWVGPADLIRGGQRVPQDQLLAVLNRELERRRTRP